VPTPLCTYKPEDWAVLVTTPDGDKPYFVAETESSLFANDLRDRESAKIRCGRAHFHALVCVCVCVSRPEQVLRPVPDGQDSTTSGRTGVFSIALALVRVAAGIAPGSPVLVDSWCMRKRFVLPLLSRALRIIGQIRRDTALFLPPDRAAAQRRGSARHVVRVLRSEQAVLVYTATSVNNR
jgi:Endonuclease domain/DDE superfamily endonuclease